ncbi:MAG: hypothetical protein K2X87_03565 [Gemmataceae bacterium]|nr:hypothetical protein [Gemmataceae bacterium]
MPHPPADDPAAQRDPDRGLPQTDFLREGERAAGPDLFRLGARGWCGDPAARTFIYTRFADPAGTRWFCEACTVGHEHLITRPGVLAALFGPDLGAVLAEATYRRPVYRTDPATGFVAVGPGGPEVVGHEADIDHIEVRRRSRGTNLFGRAGHVRGRHVVRLWLANQGWEDMLTAALPLVGAGPDTLVTLPGLEFTAEDFHAWRTGGTT